MTKKGKQIRKPDVKYAVQIYGIQQDDYAGSGGRKAGLTFGPATGADYTNSYRSHTPSEGQMCIHDMTWEEIIAQCKIDPTVFRECMEHGCTKSVELFLNDKLKGTAYPEMTGDGASILHDSIQSQYRNWNARVSDTIAGDYSNAGGWPASRIRATLNGYDEETDSVIVHPDTTTGYAGNDVLSREESLFSCFPEELRKGIVPKAVRSDTVYNDKKENNQTTYDNLWLFSVVELYGGALYPLYLRPNEGNFYTRQILNGVPFNHFSLMQGYDENSYLELYWLRSASPTYSNGACGVNGGGDINNGYVVNYNSGGLAPGFCLK